MKADKMGGAQKDFCYATRNITVPAVAKGGVDLTPDTLPVEAGRLIDKFGRHVKKLRISVTDRCNFRCQYCMPAEDIPWIPREEILTFEEIERVARITAKLGVEKIRLTGGEPLARTDVEKLVPRLVAIPGIKSVSMTTNGYFLPEKAKALKEAGLASLNISLDSLSRERFFQLTRRDYFDKVIAGIEAAREAGFPIKINAVVMRGVNDDEIADFIRWGRDNGFVVRFIEFMPLDGDDIWNRRMVVTADEILEQAAEVGNVVPLDTDPSQPARMFGFEDGPGEFGIIASVSRPFCRSCDRMRLTADGKIRNCLFAVDEFDVRDLMRAGATDDEVALAIKQAVWVKWEGHLINQKGFQKPGRSMYAIGG